MLVVAGPGSGKTRTLTHRIAHLVTRHSVPPEQCLAITFTRRAAGEMRERLRTLLPNAWEHIPLHTFHSLGLAILRENHNAAGLQRGFRIASDAERVRLLRDAMRLSEKQARSRLSGISHARRTRTPPAAEALGEALETYQREMETRNLCDLDDLVIRAADALESTPALRAQYRQRWRWVSIDEYQDVDLQQVRLVKLLVPEGGNLCAIGDPDQAIYSFRGADLRFFAEFEGDFPGTRVVRLTRNYRSDRNIVTLSAQVIAASGSGQRSVPVVEDAPERIAIHEAPTEKAEAEFIVQSLERILGGHSFFSIDSGRSAEEARGLGPRDIEARDFSFSDFAVLYRTEAQVPALVEALSRSGMPFQRRSHRRLLDHPGVGAVLDALHESPGAGSLREGIEALGLRGDLDSAEQREACELLIPVAAAYGDDLERFRSDLALGTEVDAWDPRADRISLLTLHAAKGLEFPVVFIAGCEKGLLPLQWGRSTPAELDEERRLFYVGVTRAKTKLFLSRAKKRLWRGEVRELPPSPYLADIEERLLERRRVRLPEKEAKQTDRQMDLFS